ncbi:hypothetical protein [Streptomyces sp. NPDC058280]
MAPIDHLSALVRTTRTTDWKHWKVPQHWKLRQLSQDRKVRRN